MAQSLTIVGPPVLCKQTGCGDPASVMLRQLDEDGCSSVILYCDYCWLRARRMYAPLTDHDAQEAISAISEQIEASHGR